MTKERRRLKQIHRWLTLDFPAEIPVRLRVEKMPKGFEDCLGAYWPPERPGGSGLIRICKASAQTERISTLLHEWCHAVLDPHAEAANRAHGGHTKSFYVLYGKIETSLWKAVEAQKKKL